jgi:hypothetical protein
MKRSIVNKVMVNWAASFLSVVLLLAMLTVPAMAYVAANQVVSSSIKDGSILNRDIRGNVISSSRIKDGTLLNRDIDENVISSSRIRNGTISDSDLSRKKAYLSIPVAAMSPTIDNYDYGKGTRLFLVNGSNGFFLAPVWLPQGARITKLRYNCLDNGGVYTKARLYRVATSDPNSSSLLAEASTISLANSPSWRVLTDGTITNPAVNNNSYAYVVEVFLGGPGPDTLEASTVVIEYTYKR